MTIIQSTNARPCASCFQARGACLNWCPDAVRVPIIPGHRPITIDATALDAWFGPDAFTEGPEMPVDGRTRSGRIPAWAVACLTLGGLLMVLSVVVLAVIPRWIEL